MSWLQRRHPELPEILQSLHRGDERSCLGESPNMHFVMTNSFHGLPSIRTGSRKIPSSHKLAGAFDAVRLIARGWILSDKAIAQDEAVTRARADALDAATELAVGLRLHCQIRPTGHGQHDGALPERPEPESYAPVFDEWTER